MNLSPPLSPSTQMLGMSDLAHLTNTRTRSNQRANKQTTREIERDPTPPQKANKSTRERERGGGGGGDLNQRNNKRHESENIKPTNQQTNNTRERQKIVIPTSKHERGKTATNHPSNHRQKCELAKKKKKKEEEEERAERRTRERGEKLKGETQSPPPLPTLTTT